MAPCKFYAAFLALSSTLVSFAAGAAVPAIIVFGDSTADSGNNDYIATLVKSNFPPYGRSLPGGRPTGRFSDGRVLPDFLSEALGLPGLVPAYLDPTKGISDFAVGVSFASSGTGYDNLTAAILKVIPLWKQVEYYKEYQTRLTSYLGKNKANEIIGEAIYVMSLATNDFLVNYDIFQVRKVEFSLDQYADFLVGIAERFIRELYALGARKFSYSGVNVLGCLPLERTLNLKGHRGCKEEYNAASKDFNGKLGKMLMRLNGELRGVRLVMSDLYEPHEQLLMFPQRYGFEVTDRGCCGTGELELGFLCNKLDPYTCSNAENYVFWDSFHTSDSANRFISDYVYNNFVTQLIT